MADSGRQLRRDVSAAILVAAIAVLSNCSRDEPPPSSATAPVIRIATGSPGLAFKPLGEALVAAYSRVLPDVRFEAVDTPGTVVNLRRLQAGGAELAFVVGNAVYAAYNGLDDDFRTPADKLRAVAVLHPSTVHILVPVSSTARTLADLTGRVAVGPPGTQFTAKVLIEELTQPARVVVDQTLSLLDAADALAAGRLDAAVVVGPDPVDVVRRATAKGARLLPITREGGERVRTDYPFLRPGEIPGGIYPGAPGPVATMLVDVLLVTRTGMDDELVRRLTSALFDVLPELATNFEYLRLVNMQRAPATPIPLHPGAALFYRERELSR
jgi:TRAP transporter TAXI family solute receptor